MMTPEEANNQKCRLEIELSSRKIKQLRSQKRVKIKLCARFPTCEMFASPTGQKSGLFHSMKEREERLCPIICH
jgi:hypothetical protein